MMALIAQKYYGIPKEYVKEYEKRLINKTSKLVRYSLKFLFDNIGVPVAIQSDNGQVERVNQTIKRWLAKKLHETGGRSWIEHLNNVISDMMKIDDDLNLVKKEIITWTTTNLKQNKTEYEKYD
ncbi:hypothetical protein CWI38_0990p0020 [Hamiltosporidium tvaerminnensis]|uniref:Integrase catalytic domain-containing protein n=1 Tax=Hamiltosporidium tvaerminnensis TaxID=1176355 RepID=A0A4Q9LW96_9MICR|nr:hypothetical protein CWI38_0990p0020 [Hamiltosporidium tvaerminnensis]